MKILFVCLGNICRSPIAEGILVKLCQNQDIYHWQIDSASTNTYHTGEPPHYLSQKICRKNNIDIANQRSRRITSDDFKKFDLIIVMAEDVLRDIKNIVGAQFDATKIKYFMEFVDGATSNNVLDPWYGGEEDFEKVFELIYKGCENIILNYK